MADTIKLETARVLRDNIDLRSRHKREKVWYRVREKIPNAKFCTVERHCRDIQNPKYDKVTGECIYEGRYKVEDGRYEAEEKVSAYYI